MFDSLVPSIRAYYILSSLLVLLAYHPSSIAAYDNRGPGSILEGGPHRTINELAIERFVGTLEAGDPRRKFVDGTRYPLHGPRIVETSRYFDAPREEEHPLTWEQWVIEGGFSADEPELFNSFRHFYDPLLWNPDPPLTRRDLLGSWADIQGVPYLTDHLIQMRSVLDMLQPKIPASTHGLQTGLTWEANVKVDAKSWAITGNPGRGRTANQYSWQTGVRYFREAFSGIRDGQQLNLREREQAYAMAWRSLGETMHLLADMSCVPHVRNDSHPGLGLPASEQVYALVAQLAKEKTIGLGPDEKPITFDPDMGILRNDPYERYVDESLIRRTVPDPVALSGFPANAQQTLRQAKAPEKLFDLVATFTNRRFFSADTVPFLLSNDDQLSPGYVQANECRAYPNPFLSVMDHPLDHDHDWDSPRTQADERIFAAAFDKEGYYATTIWSRKIRLCHRTWMTFAGWGSGPNSKAITYPCVEDQAAILLPLAVAANAQLLDLFIPKLELKIAEVDKKNRIVRAHIVHTPYGAFSEPLVYNGAPPRCTIFCNGRSQAVARNAVTVIDSRIEVTLDDLDLDLSQPIVMEAEIGGFCIPSQPSEALPKPTRLTMAYSFVAQGKVTRYEPISGSQEYAPKTAQEELTFHSGVSLSELPVTFQGNEFRCELVVPEQKRVTTIRGTLNDLCDKIISLTIIHKLEVKETIIETQYCTDKIEYTIELRDIDKVASKRPWSFDANPVRHLPISIEYTLVHQPYSDGEPSMGRSFSVTDVQITGGSVSLEFGTR